MQQLSLLSQPWGQEPKVRLLPLGALAEHLPRPFCWLPEGSLGGWPARRQLSSPCLHTVFSLCLCLDFLLRTLVTLGQGHLNDVILTICKNPTSK